MLGVAVIPPPPAAGIVVRKTWTGEYSGGLAGTTDVWSEMPDGSEISEAFDLDWCDAGYPPERVYLPFGKIGPSNDRAE
jgi:hypothetical protein